MEPPGPEAIRKRQREKLERLLKTVLASNPFYREKLAPAKLTREPPSLRDFRSHVPFTGKRELLEDQIRNPPFGRNLSFPLHRYTRFNQTSGSRGEPLRCLDTAETWEKMLDCWKTVYRMSGVRPADRIFFAFSFGPFLGFWTAFDAAQALGTLCIPGGGQSSLGRLRAILDNRVDVLCATPTYALHLAGVAAENGLPLEQSPVRIVLTAGEPGGCIAATRARLEAAWGARLRDHHGMTEVGPVSYECPSRRGILHVLENAYLAEVVDPATSRPLAPGETGELILTTLDRVGSPVLRYRTGDLVKPSNMSPCTCGRYELALEGGVLGRVDDMVVIRGVNLFPAAVEEVIRKRPEVSEYRVEIHESGVLKEMTIQIESSLGEGGARQLERELHAAFSLRIPVSPVPPGTLPRFEMKSRRWIMK